MTGPTRRLATGYGIVALVYVASRLLLVWRFPPHFDEAVFADWTARGVADGGNQLFLPLTAGQQPLLEWLAAGIVHVGAEPLTALRLVSLAAGLVTLGATAGIGFHLGGQRTAFAAAVLWVVLPIALVYTTVGLYDPLAAMFVALALLLQTRLARDPRLDTALLLGLVFAGTLLAKLTATVALYLIPLSALVFDWSGPRLRRRLGAWLGALGVALVMAWAGYQVLKLSDFYDDLGTGREVLAQHGIGDAVRRPWHWASVNWPTYQDALVGYLTVPLLVVLAIGLVAGVRRRAADTLLVAGWGLLPIVAIVLLADYPYTRWLTVAMPALTALIAVGCVWLVHAVRRARSGRGANVALAAVAVVVFAPALVLDTLVLASPEDAPYPGDDLKAFVTSGAAGSVWDDVAADLRRRAGGRSLVVAGGELCCQTLALELSDDANIRVVRADSDEVDRALYAVENVVGLPPRSDGLAWRKVRGFERPRNGATTVLYESGVLYGSTFTAAPDALRAAIGGTDADYDAYVGAHSAVQKWLDAWYDANG